MAATIAKWGNSLAIRIPHNLAKKIQIAEGSEVELAVVDGSLVIKPRKQSLVFVVRTCRGDRRREPAY